MHRFHANAIFSCMFPVMHLSLLFISFFPFLFLVFTFYRVGMQHADGIYFFKASWKTSSNRKLDCMLLAVAVFMRPQYVWSLDRDRQILLRKCTDLKKRPISNHGYRDYMNAAKCRTSWSLPIRAYHNSLRWIFIKFINDLYKLTPF